MRGKGFSIESVKMFAFAVVHIQSTQFTLTLREYLAEVKQYFVLFVIVLTDLTELSN